MVRKIRSFSKYPKARLTCWGVFLENWDVWSRTGQGKKAQQGWGLGWSLSSAWYHEALWSTFCTELVLVWDKEPALCTPMLFSHWCFPSKHISSHWARGMSALEGTGWKNNIYFRGIIQKYFLKKKCSILHEVQVSSS